MAVTAGFWTGTLFGGAYTAAAAPLESLIVGQLLQSFVVPTITALHMTGKEQFTAALTIGTGILNIFGNVVLIPVFGLAGSAAASSLANAVLGVKSLLRLRGTNRLRQSSLTSGISCSQWFYVLPCRSRGEPT